MNDMSIYKLIEQSQCSEPWLFQNWLKLNKPELEICYTDISMAFWNISQERLHNSPSLNTKKVAVDLSAIKPTIKNTKKICGESLIATASDLRNTPTSIISSSDINPSIAKNILQGEAGITVSNSKQPVIGSFGAGPCVIISIYSKENNACALAHVDALANPRTVVTMLLYQLEKSKSDDHMIVEMATGAPEDNSTLEELKNIISENKKIFLQVVHCSGSLAIDSRTGKTFCGVDAHSMELGSNYKHRMEKRATQAMFSFGNELPISLIFDGRDSLLS